MLCFLSTKSVLLCRYKKKATENECQSRDSIDTCHVPQIEWIRRLFIRFLLKEFADLHVSAFSENELRTRDT